MRLLLTLVIIAVITLNIIFDKKGINILALLSYPFAVYLVLTKPGGKNKS